ncbi:ADP-ribosyl-[dinitrogen reductase] hydrolase [Consotaella salsifontis]|uniref:ADP-ribosyl-[dinitrogen reductase] hydrolase n=1 Tax=Consotaella salsifontis TaxID=1365950 RepID=A0A1T4MS03_9HYPH|nr:ADP-ribosyl-[dinitrogen reductase] hydrolase [Consotaella salsifontis]SJZ69743.1 ADP-ribosyl-[dinitrogen reductase] hydrolase [Consotaella salsifontis]
MSEILEDGIRDRALGAYFGLAVGDALGATVEFLSKDEIEAQYKLHTKMIGGGWLRLKPGQVTDDTEMSLALGNSLVGRSGFDAAAVCSAFASWFRSRPVDVGNTCRRGIQRFMVHGTTETPFNEGDAGNGALMRNLPVVLATLFNPPLMEAWSLGQSRTTHNHPLSDQATIALGHMTRILVLGGSREDVRRAADKLVDECNAFRFEPYRGLSSAFVLDTVQTVLHHYFATNDFQTALIETVNQGGDADTTGALVGMLAGATYGADAIPAMWMKKLDTKVRRQIIGQVHDLLALSRQTKEAPVVVETQPTRQTAEVVRLADRDRRKA